MTDQIMAFNCNSNDDFLSHCTKSTEDSEWEDDHNNSIESNELVNFIVINDEETSNTNEEVLSKILVNIDMLDHSTQAALLYYNSAYGSCPLYPVDESTRYVPIPYPALYRYRGERLRNLNRLEYCCCEQTVKDNKEKKMTKVSYRLLVVKNRRYSHLIVQLKSTHLITKPCAPECAHQNFIKTLLPIPAKNLIQIMKMKSSIGNRGQTNLHVTV